MRKSFEQELTISQQETERLNNLLSEQRALEASLLLKLDTLKLKDEALHSRDLLRNQIGALTKTLEQNEQEIKKVRQEMEIVNLALSKLKDLSFDKRNELHTQAAKLVSKLRHTFFSFVDSATNGELKANLSSDLIPDLNGRPLFNPDTCSQFERTLMDIAFRAALLSVLANLTNTKPSLVLETPDEVADESYIPYIASAISTISKDISIIVTTYNSDLTTHLLKQYQKNERSRHFTDLVSKGTLTQRKYYEPNIAGFSGSS